MTKMAHTVQEGLPTKQDDNTWYTIETQRASWIFFFSYSQAAHPVSPSYDCVHPETGILAHSSSSLLQGPTSDSPHKTHTHINRDPHGRPLLSDLCA